jgi:hypothetical protein
VRNSEGEMAVISVRKAQALPGKEAEAIKFGTEIAKMVAEHVPSIFMPGSGRDELWRTL